LFCQIGNVGGALEEGEALGGGGLVVGGEEAAGVADQNPAILLIDPSGDGFEVNVGHHALRDEESAESVEG